MLRALLIAGTVLAAGCPSSTPSPVEPVAPFDDTALRIRVARDEAMRAAGVDDLVDLAEKGDVHARELALRGLGRIGGDTSLRVLLAAIADPAPRIETAAFAALGLAASLDDSTPLVGKVTWPRNLDRVQLVAVIEAVGRAANDQAALLAQRTKEPEAVALALGRMARRKLELSQPARAWLVTMTKHAARDVRYAATYALSREHEPAKDVEVEAALVARIVDDDPEVRATAIAAVTKRGIDLHAIPALVEALRDRDWRVAVEAARALAGPHGDDAGRAVVAANLSVRWTELARGTSTEIQVITESLRALLAHPPVRPIALEQFAGGDKVAPLATRWLVHLGAIGRGALQATTFTQGALPDHLRMIALADVFARGDDTFERAVMRFMLEHEDPRVRAAGLGMLASANPRAIDRATAVTTIAAALGSADVVIAGTAADAAGTMYDALGADPLRAKLDTALVARATKEQDPELASGLYELIGKHAVVAGAEACRAGLAGHPVRARAAAACLKALGQVVPTPAIGIGTPPPVDFEAVINKRVTWHVMTTAGEIVIELRPDIAPWNVATIVALTKRGFYDGLEFHRVVPNFVVQGGDPTMSGVGGPGFTTPAEPATSLDGPGFAEGGIGIADAGRDSGGSQWFAMHSRAPHLDGRYTYIGRIVSGQIAADSLLIGDQIVKATVELEKSRK